MLFTRQAILTAVYSSVLLTGPALAESSCYLVTFSGKVVSLSGMCAGKPTVPTQVPAVHQTTPSNSRPARTSSTESYIVSEGKGGYADRQTGIGAYYHYQVWSNFSNTQYTLKVWNDDNYPGSSPITIDRFRSAREALDHFDCRYAKKSIPACPQVSR